MSSTASTVVEGTVQDAGSRPTASGSMKYSLKVAGIYYGFFNEDPKAKMGDHVKFYAKQSADGRYWNANKCEIVGGNGNDNNMATHSLQDPRKPVATATVHTENDDERQDRIMRQNASSTAGHLVAALIGKGSLKMSASDPVFDAVMQTKKASEMIFLLSKHGYGTKFEPTKDSGVDEEIGF